MVDISLHYLTMEGGLCNHLSMLWIVNFNTFTKFQPKSTDFAQNSLFLIILAKAFIKIFSQFGSFRPTELYYIFFYSSSALNLCLKLFTNCTIKYQKLQLLMGAHIPSDTLCIQACSCGWHATKLPPMPMSTWIYAPVHCFSFVYLNYLSLPIFTTWLHHVHQYIMPMCVRQISKWSYQ